jgi:hypothetical protein
MSSPRPQDLLDRPIPDLVLDSTAGAPFGLRSRVGVRPLVLFFFIRSGTPT